MTVHEFVSRFVNLDEDITVLYFDANHNEQCYEHICLSEVDTVKPGVDCCGRPFLYITTK